MSSVPPTTLAADLLRRAGVGLMLFSACRPPTTAPVELAQPSIESPKPRVEPAAAPSPAELAPACPAGDTRWLASRPRVPLAVVSNNAIVSAGVDCCEPWRAPEARWQGVDAWGQPLAAGHVTAADYYDATRCWELTLEPQSKQGRAALYVSGDWTPSPSFQWRPSAQEQADFSVLLAALKTLTVSPEYHRSGYTKRRIPQPAFFQLPAADDPYNFHPTKFAAIGGSTFALAYLASDGAWKLGTLVNDVATPVSPEDTYDVVSILDMDADGFPEVVVHTDEGPAWDDVVLKLDNPYQRYAWTQAANSIDGGTM